MSNNKKVKPKQYTHIDYEALLIYCMKEHTSIEGGIDDFNLDIARSTVIRNIQKIKKNDKDNEVIDLYQNLYVPNMQKQKLPYYLSSRIQELEYRPVVIKDSLEDLYNKLSFMKNLVESCNNNHAEAARIISSGNTILGNVKISRQGLEKNLKYYEVIRIEYEKRNKEKDKDKEKSEE